MLTVIIPTRESERALVQTLSPLVAGATAGLIAQVIVADAGSRDATAEVAEIAGTILDVGWLEAVDAFMRSDGEAASFRPADGGGFLRRLLRPRAHPDQGLLIRKRAYDAAGGHPASDDTEAALIGRLGRVALLGATARRAIT
jgi:glycosyltransferase involved in cell wall biosynthesis